MKRLSLLPALLLLSCTPAAQERTATLALERGPYLQDVQRDRATICFWTQSEAEGLVTVGERRVKTPKGTRHFAEITGLAPATEHTYVVEVDGLKSEPAAFRTAPDADAAVTFTAFGDCRSGHETHARLVQAMAAAKPEFVLITGDLVENGGETRQWRKFFAIEAPLVRSIPIYPCMGNHERSGQEYFDTFVLGGKERWYSFDWGPLHVASVDSTILWRMHKEQLAWLRKDLAESKARFKIIFWHHAPYAATGNKFRQDEALQLQKIFSPIFRETGVCLSLGGHNHNYQRAEADGVCYVTTAGGGADLYDIGPLLPETRAARKAFHFCRLRAEGRKLTLEAVDLEGKVFDTWTHEAR